ncbi:hypothetical protein BOW65_19985 [Pseudomonas koreensis]|nr:hypothetical protein BOW65_19985 [Pseudomonas koreensis]
MHYPTVRSPRVSWQSREEQDALQTEFSLSLPVIAKSPMDEFICQATNLPSGMRARCEIHECAEIALIEETDSTCPASGRRLLAILACITVVIVIRHDC